MANTITQTVINSDFFKSEGYALNDKGRYQKQIGDLLVEFEIFDEQPEIGINIETRYNNVLQISGYYHDREDFKRDFGF